MSDKWENNNYKYSESPSEHHHHKSYYESPSDPHYPKMGYGYAAQPAPMVKKVKKVKHVYDPSYYGAASMPHAMSGKCPPVVCPPQYCVRDCYVPREVPYIHPIVNVNRYVVVNVPRHYYQPMTQNVMVDPGCPCPPQKGHH